MFATSTFVVIRLLTVATAVGVVVPAVLHEIDRPVAGLISLAMFSPVLGMPRRHPQVDRLNSPTRTPVPVAGLNDHRLRVEQLIQADATGINGSVIPGLAKLERDSHLSLGGNRTQARCQASEQSNWCEAMS